ncbi:MAG: hypothetical protein AAGI11_05880 [Pseudomonadota bacterium]
MKLKLLTAACVLIPLSANALMTKSEVAEKVEELLSAGTPLPEIIEVLIADGRNRAAATAAAVDVSTGANKLRFAKAGICNAGGPDEAAQIADAAMAVGGDAAGAIDDSVALFNTPSCNEFLDTSAGVNPFVPPAVDISGGSSAAGGVSPSQ